MLESSFLALLLAAQSGPADAIAPEVAPMATCVSPTAQSAAPESNCASAIPTVAERPAIKDHLQKWEQATQSASEWSRSQLEEFRRRLQEDFNEHAGAAAEQFVGHVNAASLMESFSWQIIEQKWGQVCLEAVPKDETERLFYSSLRIWLTADKGIPQRLAIVGRNRATRTVWHAEHFSGPALVQLVQFERTVPPAPNKAPRRSNGQFD